MTNTWELHFYEDPQGREPVKDWLAALDDVRGPAAVAALQGILAELGTDVCQSEWGKSLKQGLYEFRIRNDAGEVAKRVRDPAVLADLPEGEPGKVLLRIFFHAHGDRLILLLGAYDKGEDTSSKRQDKEIKTARSRLRAWKEEAKRAQKASRSGPGNGGSQRPRRRRR